MLFDYLAISDGRLQLELLALAYKDTLSTSIWRAQLGKEYLEKKDSMCIFYNVKCKCSGDFFE